MPTGCCGGSNCGCKLVGEGRVEVTGAGSANDPFVLDVAAEFADAGTTDFVSLWDGDGTIADPWEVQVSYALTAKLDNIPDVNASTPTNGQVLAWNTATSKWVPQAPTTAPAGAVLHDTSLVGDGSVGTPLAVVPIASRLLGTFAGGLGLNDLGMGSVVQHFVDAAARTAAIPVPIFNQLTILDSAPGVVWHWNGTIWATPPGQAGWVGNDELMELSGPFSLGLPVTVMVKQVSTTTDGAGVMDILDASDLTGRSGVLAVTVQERGAVAWKAMVFPNTTKISATAYRLTDGTALVGTPLTASVQAILY